MKNRFWLFRRDGIFYLQDAQTRRKESLNTRDGREARRLRDARNDSKDCPNLAISLAKAYLCARDGKIGDRTWRDVIDQFCARGKPQTRAHRLRVCKRQPFDFIRGLKLLETTANDFLQVLGTGGVMVQAYLRCLHNLALGLGWLPWPVLATKLWPAAPRKAKRSIKEQEQQLIIAAERNAERRLFYQLLWETGASQSDAASLQGGNVDWRQGLLSYQRLKTGECAVMRIGDRLSGLLKQLPSEGPLFPKISLTSSNDRAAEFYRRCRLLGIKGVSLHSYRYAWAERARDCGYPERFAQQALGHSSSAVHHAYARNSHGPVPPLDDFEAAGKVLPFPVGAGNRQAPLPRMPNNLANIRGR